MFLEGLRGNHEAYSVVGSVSKRQGPLGNGWGDGGGGDISSSVRVVGQRGGSQVLLLEAG